MLHFQTAYSTDWATNPKLFMLSTKTAVHSIPIVAMAVPKIPAALDGNPELWPSEYAEISAIEIVKQGTAHDSNPTAMPAMTFVPCNTGKQIKYDNVAFSFYSLVQPN